MQGIYNSISEAMFLGYIVLQPLCIKHLCCMGCYVAREICFVLLHLYIPKYVNSAQYGYVR
jgi:hypothetical protein